MAAELKVKSGGVWRTITAPEVKYSGSWRAIKTIEVKFGGVWREVFALVTGPIVSMFGGINYNYRYQATCYAGVQFNSSGVEYWQTAAGAWTVNKGNWLDSGASSEVWVLRVINSGSLSWDGIGGLRVPLSTTRGMNVNRSSQGFKTCIVTCYMYDAAAGGNLLESKQYTLQAEYDSGA